MKERKVKGEAGEQTCQTPLPLTPLKCPTEEEEE